MKTATLTPIQRKRREMPDIFPVNWCDIFTYQEMLGYYTTDPELFQERYADWKKMHGIVIELQK